ncbi:MAG TPA: hypothetical protein VM925_02295 [Labilithrix sp.]|nr:hypothetical protein [Labilithrix sp.]
MLTVTFLAGCGTSADTSESGTGATQHRGGGDTATSVGQTGPADDARSKPHVIDHLLVTGQSNSVGFAARPPLTTAQPSANLMFDVGVMTARSCDADGCTEYQEPSKLVPLVEGDAYFDYPVETIASGLANTAAKLTGSSSQLLVSIHGRSGNSYECLRKGGCAFYAGKNYIGAFDEALRQVADAKRLVSAQGAVYTVRAVAAIHGESDHYAPPFPIDGTSGSAASVQNYSDALLEWQRDYDASIRAVTGQSEGIPLLVSQMSNWNDRPDSEIPTYQLDAHTRAPGKVVLVGPTYMLPFADDCIHFTSDGERRLGEYFARAYASLRAGKWEPLRPLGATLAGDTIRIRFLVPSPPLVLDTEHVTDPGHFGFEYVDDSGATPEIVEVTVTGPDEVAIKLASAPEPQVIGGHVRYAMRATPYTCPGPTQGPRGNLRDSDATQSLYGYDLRNWAVHFELPVQ